MFWFGNVLVVNSFKRRSLSSQIASLSRLVSRSSLLATHTPTYPTPPNHRAKVPIAELFSTRTPRQCHHRSYQRMPFLARARCPFFRVCTEGNAATSGELIAGICKRLSSTGKGSPAGLTLSLESLGEIPIDRADDGGGVGVAMLPCIITCSRGVLRVSSVFCKQ